MKTIGEQTIARLDARIVPLFLITYVVNFLDRVNVGFASLQMNERLSFGPEVYGFGAGIFFLGYFLFEVPSNLMLAKVGPRYWLTRIMLTWGVVSACTALVSTANGFYLVRFLLGVAEAGFVPALLVYLTNWYPAADRASAVAKIWSATAIAVVLGGPLSGSLLGLDGVLGLDGWQWMFILEALPAVVLAGLLFAYMTERPAQAAWLTGAQRDWLTETLAGEEADRIAQGGGSTVGAALRDPRTWILSLLYFCLGIGFFGVTLWLPQVVKQISGLSNAATSFVTAIPFACAIIAMLAASRHSDRTGERKWHVAVGALVAGVGFSVSGNVASPAGALVALSLGAMGLWSVIGIFWQLPSAYLGGSAAAVGVAVINACGSLGGFVGPYLIGVIRGASADYGTAMLAVGGAMLAAAAIAASLRTADGGRRPTTETRTRPALEGTRHEIDDQP